MLYERTLVATGAETGGTGVSLTSVGLGVGSGGADGVDEDALRFLGLSGIPEKSHSSNCSLRS